MQASFLLSTVTCEQGKFHILMADIVFWYRNRTYFSYINNDTMISNYVIRSQKVRNDPHSWGSMLAKTNVA